MRANVIYTLSTLILCFVLISIKLFADRLHNSNSVRSVNDTAQIRSTTPSVYGFYNKLLYCDSIPIRSANVVADSALFSVSKKIKTMLLHMPVVHYNLVQYGAELHISGRDQIITDLPEYANKKETIISINGFNVPFGKRYHGFTALFSVCNEENILDLPNNKQHGYDVCTHEFAHSIMFFGLDTVIKQKIKNTYQQAIARGLWQDSYAATNDREYFAELSTWYFGSKWNFLGLGIKQVGRESLANYDPEGYALVDDIYSGRTQPIALPMVPAKKITTKVMAVDKRQARFEIFNDTEHTIKMFWVNHSDVNVKYGTILPFHNYHQPTSYSDVWILEDETGQQYKYFKADAPFCKIKVSTIAE